MSNTENKQKRVSIGKDIATRRRVARARRHFRIRKNLRGTPEAPRLVVHRSSRHMHVQIIDDVAGHTLAAASSIEAEVRATEGDKKAKGAKVGQLIAERAKAAGIDLPEGIEQKIIRVDPTDTAFVPSMGQDAAKVC